MAVGVQR